jgi:hypothetical protein
VSFEPKRPAPHWSRLPVSPQLIRAGGEAYSYGGVQVVTQVGCLVAGGPVLWVISVSRAGRSPTDRDVSRALAAFGMEKATEIASESKAREFAMQVPDGI